MSETAGKQESPPSTLKEPLRTPKDDEDIASPLPFHPDPDSVMDLDFADLDATLQFDELIPPSPSFFPSTSDQSFSYPVWAFQNCTDEKSAAAASAAATVAGAAFSAGLCVSPDFRLNPYDRDQYGNAVNDRQEDNNSNDFSQSFRGLSLPPLGTLDLSSLLKERMTQALRYFKDTTEQHQILAQVWTPIRRGNRFMLTTLGQPFILSSHSCDGGLHQYRAVSLTYTFTTDYLSDRSLGLPGRVFRQRSPEWTPDVQLYSSKEYPRINHAKDYNIHGSLAVPVFEPMGLSCVGVVELIMTSHKINYAPEVDKVCRALEAVDLKSSDTLDQPDFMICNKGRQNAFAEIIQVVTEVCETYKLPLSQTWIPCKHRNILAAYSNGVDNNCSTSFEAGGCMDQVCCMSTSDLAFYVVDARMCYFQEACSEHHLQRGQGVAGRALMSKGLCICEDIRWFSKTEYPLVHYAKMFGLSGSFAICLRSKYTGEDDYVLEFFLPMGLTGIDEKVQLLDLILGTIKLNLQNLMVASGRGLEVERQCMEIVNVAADDEDPDDFLAAVEEVACVDLHRARSLPSLEGCLDRNVLAVLPKDGSGGQKAVLEEEAVKDNVEERKDVALGSDGEEENVVAPSHLNKEVKKGERKRGKAEKKISLEQLQQHFAGSLKDAAKSLGVCPTTMKRVCRQHGILRWPSRKINKVNRSLTKLKHVMESVHGTSGAFDFSSLHPAFNTSTTFDLKQKQLLLESNDISILPAAIQRNNERAMDEAEPNTSPRTALLESGCHETSTGGTSSTSHGSCQGNLEQQLGDTAACPVPLQSNLKQNISAAPVPHLITHHHRGSFGRLLSEEDAESSKDLRKRRPSAAGVNVEVRTKESSWVNPNPANNNTAALVPEIGGGALTPRFQPRQEMRNVTMKATFRQDIIRFRFPLESSIVDLKEEVAKRFKLEVGTFEIKYLDDDEEWVLLACDDDLQECLDLIASSGSSIVRLSVHNILRNPGSCCESNEG